MLIVAYSIWQGIYNLDPHHWGLMLSNAKDLFDGKAPYREIFVQYGLLTTLVHAAAYALLGENLRALIGVTALFYAVGLVGVYLLCLRITADKKLSLFSFVSACLVHPVAIYPWSNYIAFPFLVYGMWFLFARRAPSASAFFGGLALALAVLAREGLFPAVLIFSLIVSVLNFISAQESRWARMARDLWFFCGLFLPLTLFFAYLYHENLLAYWYKTAVMLPRMYVTVLMPQGLEGAAYKLLRYFVMGIIDLNTRVIFFALILLSSAYVAKSFLRPEGAQRPPAQQFLLALLALLLLSAALHGNEIFRLASGVSVGVVILYSLARRSGNENLLFLASSLLLIASTGRGTDGNYFVPTKQQISQSVEVDAPNAFRGQRWPLAASNFYQSFDRDMSGLVSRHCGIRYYQNTSHDAFLSVLSPFEQYQVAPFKNDIGWERLRPELDVQKKIVEDKDIVLFLKVSESSIEEYRPPDGYSVARRYIMPKVLFFEQGDYLLIVAPQRCSGFFVE
jgi:hypothetical protein